MTTGSVILPASDLQAPETNPALRVGDVRLGALSAEEVPLLVERVLAEQGRLRLSVCRTRHVVAARKDARTRGALLASDLVVATGRGMRVLGRCAGRRVRPPRSPARVAAATLAAAAASGWRVFFLGDEETPVFDWAHEAASCHAGLRTAGALQVPLKALTESRERRLVQRINEAHADIVLDAPANVLGFAQRHARTIDAPVVMTLHGGARGGLLEALSADAGFLPGFLAAALATLRHGR